MAELSDDRAWLTGDLFAWRREPWAPTPSFRIQTVVEAPAQHVASVLREVDLCELAGAKVSRYRTLVSANDPHFTRRVFFVNPLLGFALERCYSVECRVQRNWDDAIGLMWYSVPPLAVIESEEVWGVWGEVRFAGCHIRPLSPTRCQLRRIVNVDPRLNAPAWLIEYALRESHRKACVRAATFRGSEAEERAKGDPFVRSLQASPGLCAR